MPKINIKFNTEEEIPAGLRPYANGTEVEMWVGDNVASETNPGLASNRDAILREKEAVQKKYNELVSTTAQTAQELNELRIQLANGQTVAPADVQVLNQVKALGRPEEILPKLSSLDSITSELNSLKQEKLYRDVFQTMGYKNEKVFMDLVTNPTKMAGVQGISFETETRDNKTVRKPMVVLKDASNVETKKAFGDYIKENAEWQPYLSALAGEQDKDNRMWFSQNPADTQRQESGGSLLAKVIDGDKKAVSSINNPLQPNPTLPKI